LFRAVITSGTTPVGPDDDPANGIDIVVMDDFIFGEPIPEPTTGLLLLLGMTAQLGRRRRV